MTRGWRSTAFTELSIGGLLSCGSVRPWTRTNRHAFEKHANPTTGQARELIATERESKHSRTHCWKSRAGSLINPPSAQAETCRLFWIKCQVVPSAFMTANSPHAFGCVLWAKTQRARWNTRVHRSAGA